MAITSCTIIGDLRKSNLALGFKTVHMAKSDKILFLKFHFILSVYILLKTSKNLKISEKHNQNESELCFFTIMKKQKTLEFHFGLILITQSLLKNTLSLTKSREN